MASTMNIASRIRRIALAVCMSALFCSCGGGTAGSGIGGGERVFEGSVFTFSNEPLANVDVTVDETGASAVSDSSGEFVLRTEIPTDTLTFHLKGRNLDTTFAVNVHKEVTTPSMRIDVKVQPDTSDVEVKQFAADVRMVGICSAYFSNQRVIRQTAHVPPGTTCTLRIELFGDGELRGNVPVGLEFRSCTPGAPWRPLVTGFTDNGIHLGIAKLYFEFQESPEFCKYRVLVPYHSDDDTPIRYDIETFAENALAAK
jgi:hypothetical protein